MDSNEIQTIVGIPTTPEFTNHVVGNGEVELTWSQSLSPAADLTGYIVYVDGVPQAHKLTTTMTVNSLTNGQEL